MTDRVNKRTLSKPLYRIFTGVPRRYDLINRIATWCLDERWRLKAAVECLSCHPERVLDLCCGTGDLAIILARLSENYVSLAGVDYSQPMLDIAARKAEYSAAGSRISFFHADVANLAFPDGYFNSVGISFAFRNLTYKNPLADRYLAEVLRILTDGGRFVIVETSQPESRLIQRLFHLYMRWFVYWVGCLLSRNRAAYRYMSESVARFFSPREVVELLLKAGFRQVSSRSLFLGAISIHIAVK